MQKHKEINAQFLQKHKEIMSFGSASDYAIGFFCLVTAQLIAKAANIITARRRNACWLPTAVASEKWEASAMRSCAATMVEATAVPMAPVIG